MLWSDLNEPRNWVVDENQAVSNGPQPQHPTIELKEATCLASPGLDRAESNITPPDASKPGLSDV
ncbi:hypothetical protein BFJ68_g17669 [Fusarium oxysporum]|uniref:Uncharacterized protein n=1 Tax=Fusarium oxysporum TaxID=5507 RepID=A0A420NL22_FUSOX|nr:hypothetical protein BFJ68_g17669 [Fusarium oxysporum]